MWQTLIRLLIAAALSAAVAFGPPPAAADTARDLKDTGMVGERLDGYLGLVDPGAPAQIRQMVEAINAQRRAAFEQAAQSAGRALREVEAVAGAQLREKARPGDWIQNAAGEWIRKP